MMNDKAKCVKIAKKYDFHYWDGSRRTGYGGYKYIPGHWKGMAKQLIKDYKLKSGSKVLDVGCGKAFLLHEMKLLEPGLEIMGFDISKYALENNTEITKPHVYFQKAQDKYRYNDKEIDLVISLNVLHNLKFFDLKKAFFEINRVGKQAYIVVESYRNEEELSIYNAGQQYVSHFLMLMSGNTYLMNLITQEITNLFSLNNKRKK